MTAPIGSICSSTTQPQNTSTYFDYLDRKVTELPFSENGYALEKVETAASMIMVKDSIIFETGLNDLVWPQLAQLRGKFQDSHLGVSQVAAQIGCLYEALNQRMRKGIGIPSDVPYQVDPEGRWFTRHRPKSIDFGEESQTSFESSYRFSATLLKEGDITETFIADMTGLFYREVLYNIDLMGPEETELGEKENHRFRVVGDHIVVGLPLYTLEYCRYTRSRHDNLIEFFKQRYPLQLFRDVDKGIEEALATKASFERIIKYPGYGSISLKLRIASLTKREGKFNFKKACIELYEQKDKPENSVLKQDVQYLYFAEMAIRSESPKVLAELEEQLNSKFGEGFQSEVFSTPYEVFKKIFLESVIGDYFLLEQIYQAGLNDQKYDDIFRGPIQLGII